MAWADFWEMLHAVTEDDWRKAGKVSKKKYTKEEAEKTRKRMLDLAIRKNVFGIKQ